MADVEKRQAASLLVETASTLAHEFPTLFIAA
jgi:hypothetical protein